MTRTEAINEAISKISTRAFPPDGEWFENSFADDVEKILVELYERAQRNVHP